MVKLFVGTISLYPSPTAHLPQNNTPQNISKPPDFGQNARTTTRAPSSRITQPRVTRRADSKAGYSPLCWRPFQSVSMESDALALLHSLASSVSRWKQPFIVGIGAESIAEPSSANSFSSGMRSAEPLIMHRLDMTPHRHSIA